MGKGKGWGSGRVGIGLVYLVLEHEVLERRGLDHVTKYCSDWSPSL